MVLVLPGGTDTADLVANAFGAHVPVIDGDGRPVTSTGKGAKPSADSAALCVIPQNKP